VSDPPPPPKAIRAFVGLPLPPSLHAAVVETLRRLKASLRDVRFVREDGLHLTVRFLGWTRPERLTALEPALREAAGACPPLDMTVRGVGTFPERGRPRVLWLGVELPPPAQALAAACERAAVQAGFEPEPRAFRPHLTLGRWTDRAPRPALPDQDIGTARDETHLLYRSQMQAAGSLYTPLATFPLGAGAPPAVH
jgi:2'-5' RNA ligase